MVTLKDLAAEGKTVVVTIHQPRSSIFGLFDDLVLLSEGGLVYGGPAAEAVGYVRDQGFQCPPNYNPAEFLADLISVDHSSPEGEAHSQCGSPPRLRSSTQFICPPEFLADLIFVDHSSPEAEAHSQCGSPPSLRSST